MEEEPDLSGVTRRSSPIAEIQCKDKLLADFLSRLHPCVHDLTLWTSLSPHPPLAGGETPQLSGSYTNDNHANSPL